MDSVYSKRIRAGKRRTYFFDVRTTRGNDYYLTITESRKRFNDDGYDRHKIFLYKEDFNKFTKALGEAVDHVKTDLMPDFDFDAFNHEYDEEGGEGGDGAQNSGYNGGYNNGNNGGYNSGLAQHNTTPTDHAAAEVPADDVPASAPEPTPISSSNPTPPEIEGDNGSEEQVDKW